MFRCWNTGKPPTDAVIDLWLSCYFCCCCCSQSGLLLFEVLHSVQQCSPLLKNSLISWLRFPMDPTGARRPRLTLIASEKNMQKFQPFAAFATGTNLELWFHEWIKFTHQMLVNYLWNFNICRETNAAVETLGAPWQSLQEENNKGARQNVKAEAIALMMGAGGPAWEVLHWDRGAFSSSHYCSAQKTSKEIRGKERQDKTDSWRQIIFRETVFCWLWSNWNSCFFKNNNE